MGAQRDCEPEYTKQVYDVPTVTLAKGKSGKFRLRLSSGSQHDDEFQMERDVAFGLAVALSQAIAEDAASVGANVLRWRGDHLEMG